MEISLTVEKKDQILPLRFYYQRMVNAGYVGRNQDEVRKHIEELAKEGVPGPKTIPTLYPVVSRMLITDSKIEVYSNQTSGEVEYVLLVKNEEEIYVGLGSDHTDRHLEKTDIPRAKQICPNILSKKVWPLDEIKDHWDDLMIRSKVWDKGKEILYQKGRLGLILNVDSLLDFVRTKIGERLTDIVIYSGTIGTLTGEPVFGERFEAELIDNNLNRRLDLAYEIHPLNYLSIDE